MDDEAPARRSSRTDLHGAERTDVSCGICTANTPAGLVRMWWTEQADPYDVLVDLDGGHYVKLTDYGYPFA